MGEPRVARIAVRPLSSSSCGRHVPSETPGETDRTLEQVERTRAAIPSLLFLFSLRAAEKAAAAQARAVSSASPKP